MPIAFADGVCPHRVLVESPLAGRPSKNLVGRPDVVSGDARPVRGAEVIEIRAVEAEALRVDVGAIGGSVVRPRLPRIARDLPGTGCIAWKGGARRKRSEVGDGEHGGFRRWRGSLRWGGWGRRWSYGGGGRRRRRGRRADLHRRRG